jgi:hypothetical protein
LSQLVELFCREIMDSPKRDCIYAVLQVLPQQEKSQEAMQSVLDNQSCPGIIGHVPILCWNFIMLEPQTLFHS